MKIMVATPFYEVRGYAPYIRSLVVSVQALTMAGYDVEYYTHCGDSYVDRGKNHILWHFLKSDCQQLIMIDSDLEWDLDGFLRFVKADVDFVAGVFPTKNAWEEYPCTINCHDDHTPIVNDEGLISADLVPGGFVKFKREMLETMCKAYENCRYMVHGDAHTGLFQTKMAVDGVYRGEDYEFCAKWLALGGDIWIEPRINFFHYGLKGYNGNYHNFLLRQPGGSEESVSDEKHPRNEV